MRPPVRSAPALEHDRRLGGRPAARAGTPYPAVRPEHRAPPASPRSRPRRAWSHQAPVSQDRYLSASSATSRRKCETRTIVVPATASRRTTGAARPTSGRGKGGGRLVHDDQPGVTATARAGSRPSAAAADRRPRPAGRRELEAGRGGDTIERRASARRRTKPPPARLEPEEDILGDRECGTIDGSWATVAIPCTSASRGEWNASARPSIRSSPSSGAYSPATILPSVDLPAPFRPPGRARSHARRPARRRRAP